MAKLKLSAPWYITVREFEVLFNYDEDVHVVYDEENHLIKLYVEDVDKAAALEELLPKEYCFGNVTLDVEVVPSNSEDELMCMNLQGNNTTKDLLYDIAFNGNPIYSFANTIRLGTNTITYVVFQRMVVQFFIDDLGDAFGNRSTLYQEIAKDIFGEEEGVSFCTDVVDIEIVEDKSESADISTKWP